MFIRKESSTDYGAVYTFAAAPSQCVISVINDGSDADPTPLAHPRKRDDGNMLLILIGNKTVSTLVNRRRLADR